MPWIEITESENLPDGLKFNVGSTLKFCIEVPRPSNRESWDFAGWAYLISQDSLLGQIEGKWQRIYLGKKQKINFNREEISASYYFVFNPVNWLTFFEIKLWGWTPVDWNRYEELTIDTSFVEILPVNFNRKDYQIINIGTEDIHYYWGESGTWAILQPGIVIEESNTNNFFSLRARAANNQASIKVIERSEV